MGRGINFPISKLWPLRRRARIESVYAEAEALIHEFGAAAYLEACRREHESSSDAMARDRERVALAVASKLGARVGRGLSDRKAANADFAPDRGGASTRVRRPGQMTFEAEEPKPVLEGRPQSFRIQYLGTPSDHRSSLLKEVEIEVLDVSTAIVAAANLVWLPHTTALRILDREGR